MPMPQPVANPFALMLDPQSILDRIEQSTRLEQLERRVCRPLDKPMLGKPDSEPGDSTDAGNEGDLADSSDAADGREAA